MTTFYSRYNSIARSEDDSGPGDRATRDLVLTMIEEYLKAREEGFLTDEQKAVYDVCRKAGETERMLPTARQNTVKDGDGTVHNLTAAQYYDYQGNFNSIYWSLVKEALPQVSGDTEKETVLKTALDAAGEMAKNNALIKMGAATTKEYKRYEDLQLYSVPISTYLVAKARTKDIKGLKDKRTGDTITNSQGALIAEAVREMELDLPETNLRMLMDKLDVGDTVLGWKESKLTRELKKFRKDAGVA